MRPPRNSRHLTWILPATLLVGSFAAMAQDRPKPAVSPRAEPLSPFRLWMRSLGLSRHTISDDRGILVTESSLVGPRRSYQKWKDGLGNELEIYLENGQANPIDEGVRGWVETALREGAAPAPPTPPALPEVPSLPPMPSHSDSRQSFSDSEWGRVILNRVQGDGRLAAILGSPLSTPPWEGRVHINTWEKGEPHGFSLFSPAGGIEVELLIPISGPKGAALLAVKVQKRESDWTFSKLEAQPSQGGPRLNLLAKSPSPG